MIQGRKGGAVRTWNSGSCGAYCSTGTRAHCSTRRPRKNTDENQEVLLYRLKLGPTAMLL